MKVLHRRHWITALLFGMAMLVTIGVWWHRAPAMGSNAAQPPGGNFWENRQVTATLQSGFAQADQAAKLAENAATVADWDQVVSAWAGAIATLQTVPMQSPQRFFVQRNQQQFLANLAFAQQRADQLPDVFPSLGSAVLDDQLRLYLSYIAALGPPDILIVGSSRTLQGLDPLPLQTRLNEQGYPVRVFNFSVNGATAQVMNFVLQRLLTPDQLPKLVIWGDGSRAFNSRRLDATFAQILKSPGYQALLTGQRPGFSNNPPLSRRPTELTAQGFLPVADVFNPAVFYDNYPRINGLYDGFYNPFGLAGLQEGSLRSLVNYLKRRNIELIFVHLPLSGDYLDDYRLPLDQQFQRFLQIESQGLGFTVIDLLSQWTNQNIFFADPSHINQRGAAVLGQQLAQSPVVLEKLINLNK